MVLFTMQMSIGIFNPTLCLVFETKMKALRYVSVILQVSRDMPFFLCCMGVKIRFCLLVLCYRNFFKKIGWVNTTIFLWRIHQEVPVYYMTYPKFISIRFLLSRPELIFSIRLLDLLWECRLY